jgi:hypothetical protein
MSPKFLVVFLATGNETACERKKNWQMVTNLKCFGDEIDVLKVE